MAAPRYTRHARQRMAVRAISEQEVETILDHFDTEYTDRDGNRILVGEASGRRIKVVVARGSEPPLIITVAPKDGE